MRPASSTFVGAIVDDNGLLRWKARVLFGVPDVQGPSFRQLQQRLVHLAGKKKKKMKKRLFFFFFFIFGDGKKECGVETGVIIT